MSQVKLLTENSIESGKNYVKFPDGTMIQFLNGKVNTGDAKSIMFVTPFKDANVVVAPVGNWDSSIYLTNVYFNEIYVNAYSKNGYKECSYNLIAFGRWK